MDEKNIIMTASQCQQSHFAKSNIHRERSRVTFRRQFAMRVGGALEGPMSVLF